jgi:hypothetical protein
MIAPYPCPDCGGALDLDPESETEVTIWRKGTSGVMPYLDTLRRPCVVAACTSCEFCTEVRISKEISHGWM